MNRYRASSTQEQERVHKFRVDIEELYYATKEEVSDLYLNAQVIINNIVPTENSILYTRLFLIFALIFNIITANLCRYLYSDYIFWSIITGLLFVVSSCILLLFCRNIYSVVGRFSNKTNDYIEYDNNNRETTLPLCYAVAVIVINFALSSIGVIPIVISIVFYRYMIFDKKRMFNQDTTSYKWCYIIGFCGIALLDNFEYMSIWTIIGGIVLNIAWVIMAFLSCEIATHRLIFSQHASNFRINGEKANIYDAISYINEQLNDIQIRVSEQLDEIIPCNSNGKKIIEYQEKANFIFNNFLETQLSLPSYEGTGTGNYDEYRQCVIDSTDINDLEDAIDPDDADIIQNMEENWRCLLYVSPEDVYVQEAVGEVSEFVSQLTPNYDTLITNISQCVDNMRAVAMKQDTSLFGDIGGGLIEEKANEMTEIFRTFGKLYKEMVECNKALEDELWDERQLVVDDAILVKSILSLGVNRQNQANEIPEVVFDELEEYNSVSSVESMIYKTPEAVIRQKTENIQLLSESIGHAVTKKTGDNFYGNVAGGAAGLLLLYTHLEEQKKINAENISRIIQEFDNGIDSLNKIHADNLRMSEMITALLKIHQELESEIRNIHTCVFDGEVDPESTSFKFKPLNEISSVDFKKMGAILSQYIEINQKMRI